MLLVSLLACPLLAAAVPTAPPKGVIKFPLARANAYMPRSNGEVDAELLLTSLNNTLKKYHSKTLLPSYQGFGNLLGGVLDKRAVSNVPLTDQVESMEDELYYGHGTVGGQSGFTFDFDTGSSDLFVPGPKCGKAQGCSGTVHYKNTGTDEHRTTSVTYGSGQISGEDYLDTVCVGGLCANNVNVISLTSAQGFSSSASNSLMGMGFEAIAQSKKPTFFEDLIAQGKVTKPEFSFYLGRAKSHTQGRSEMTLGGTDASRYSGAFTKVPVTTKGYWQVAVDSVTVGGTSAGPTTNGQAAIDTGTTIVLAPTIAATAIFALIPGSVPLPLVSGSSTITLFAYPCNTKSIPAITFAGKSFAINPLDFNFGTLTTGLLETLSLTNLLGSAGGLCIAGLGAADIDPTENLYVVGDVFLKNWYATFNHAAKPSVNFAKAAGNQ